MFIDNEDGTYNVVVWKGWKPIGSLLIGIQLLIHSRQLLSILSWWNATWNIDADDLWVALLEKAYAQANEIGLFEEGSNDGYNSYESIEGGMEGPLSHISGYAAHTYSDYNWSNIGEGFLTNTYSLIYDESDFNDLQTCYWGATEW